MVSNPRTSPRHIKLHYQPAVTLQRPYEPAVDISGRMRLVRRRHTTVERLLCSALRRCGLRFSTHITICGCTPDIVFPLERLIVFVDGDFWHGRILLDKGRRSLLKSFNPKARKFWVLKITKNVARDRRQVQILRRNGWSVARLWEKDILKDPSRAAAAVRKRLLCRKAKLKLRSDAA